MPYAFLPPGYRAVLLGQAAGIEDLSIFTPLEEGAAEGTLMLMRLDFTEYPSGEALRTLEQACYEAGIEPWPGSEYYVYADDGTPSVYLIWQKGMAWLPIIIGILATVILPPLLGSLLWLILPESVKQLINGLIQMGMMLLVMWLMMTVMKPLTAPAKPKKIEESRE